MVVGVHGAFLGLGHEAAFDAAAEEATAGLEAPLLPARAAGLAPGDRVTAAGVIVVDNGHPAATAADAPTGDVRLNAATAALTSTLLGAGVLALPRAFAILGLLPGAALLLAALALSRFSLAALAAAAAAAGAWSYEELCAAHFGRGGRGVLRAAICLNNAGALVIYLDALGDILVGVPANGFSGLWTNAVGVHDPTSPLASRAAAVGAVTALLLAPLVAARSLRALAPVARAAVGVAFAFAAAVAGLAAAAVAQGRAAPDVRWVARPSELGPTPAAAALAALGVLPVVAMSYVCHYNLLPVAASLERLDGRRLGLVVRRALGGATALFAAVALGGAALFGRATAGNVLLNLTPAALDALLPAGAAAPLCAASQAAYALCLLATFAMVNWALREALCRTLFGRGAEALPRAAFAAFSWAVLAALYAVSIAFPSVWAAMSLTGGTAAATVAFTLPGLLALRAPGGSAAHRAGGGACVAAGALMAAVGVAGVFVGHGA
jgi:amino acid permease